MVSPFRRWIARYGRWVASVGWIFVVYGLWCRLYDRAAFGFAVGAIAAWGMLLDADQPGKPVAFRRGNLTFLMWAGAVCAMLTGALAVSART